MMKKAIRILVIFFVIFSVDSNVCSSKEQKDVAFILLQDGKFKFDFEDIYEPKKRVLILIISEEALHKVTDKQKRYFSRIVINKDFSISHLYAQCKNILAQTNTTNPQKIRFSTIDENLVETLDRLNTLFGINSVPQGLNKFRDKTIMKTLVSNKGLKTPKYLVFDPKEYTEKGNAYLEYISQYLGPKMFAKPIDSQGSIGTQKIFSKVDLERWAKNHERGLTYEVDEYIEGTLYHCDLIVLNGKVHYIFVSQYATPAVEFLAGNTQGGYILNPDRDEYTRLQKFAEHSIYAFAPLPDGIMHMEIFERKQDRELVFLEVAYRPAGAAIPEMYEKSLGINIQSIHTAIQLGVNLKINPKLDYFAAWVWFPVREGTLMKTKTPQLNSSFASRWLVKVGQKMSAPLSIRDRIVGYLIWNKDYNELQKDYRYLLNEFVPFDISSN